MSPPKKILNATPEFFVLSTIQRLNHLQHGNYKTHFNYLRSRIEELKWDDNVKQSYIRRLNLREAQLSEPPPPTPPPESDAGSGTWGRKTLPRSPSEGSHPYRVSVSLEAEKARRESHASSSRGVEAYKNGANNTGSAQERRAQLIGGKRGAPDAAAMERSHADREDALLGIAGQMKGMASQMRGVIQSDNAVMDDLSTVLDSHVNAVKGENVKARALLKSNTLHFFTTMIMLAISIALFCFMVPFIFSTTLTNRML